MDSDQGNNTGAGNQASDDDDDDQLVALCMKCRDDNNKPTMKPMKNPQVEEKNGRYSARGICVNCGGNMFKFLSKDDATKIQQGN